MRHNATLRARIAKLEKRLDRRLAPRFIFALDPHEQAGEPTGFIAGNVTFLRLDNESVEACRDRALAASCAPFLIATYGREARYASPERDEAVSACPTPADAVAAPSDPFDRAGIGVKATAEQLRQSGAVRGPAERPI